MHGGVGEDHSKDTKACRSMLNIRDWDGIYVFAMEWLPMGWVGLTHNVRDEIFNGQQRQIQFDQSRC